MYVNTFRDYLFVDFNDTLVHTSYANFLAYKEAIKNVCGIEIAYISERFTHTTLLQIDNPRIQTNYDKIVSLKDSI